MGLVLLVTTYKSTLYTYNTENGIFNSILITSGLALVTPVTSILNICNAYCHAYLALCFVCGTVQNISKLKQ